MRTQKANQMSSLGLGLAPELTPELQNDAVQLEIVDRLGDQVSELVGQVGVVEHVHVVLRAPVVEDQPGNDLDCRRLLLDFADPVLKKEKSVYLYLKAV